MRVLFVAHYAQLYGANRSLLALIEGLPRHGVECIVVCPGGGPAAERFRAAGCRVLVRKIDWWCMRAELLDSYNFFGRLHLIRRVLRSLRRPDTGLLSEVTALAPDVVYTNSSVTCLGRALARRLRLPHVWHLREFIDEHYDFRFILGSWLSRRIVFGSHAVIANSRALRDYFARGRRTTKVQVVYNGVVPGGRLASLRPAAIGVEGTLRLLMIGAPHPKKGYEVVCAALGRVNHEQIRVTLAIAGGNKSDSAWILDAAANQGVSGAIELLGYVDDPLPLYAHYDGYVMASEMEAMGRVTAEAMVMGLPVLGHASGGTPEIVRDGETGYLYHGGAPELVIAIERVLSDRERWREMGARARQEATARFLEENYVDAVARVLAGVCAAAPSHRLPAH